MKCHLCDKDCSSLTALHRHLTSSHKCSQQEYYHSFHPRHDLHTGDLIDYKDYKHYHNTDFNSRESFSEWLADHYKDTFAKEYCLSKVRERMTRKLITVLPSHVALKSLLLPSIHGFEKMYGSLEVFEKAMVAADIKRRFNYSEQPILHSGEMTVFVDSREQLPLHFASSKPLKLSVGDYAPNKEFYSDVYVDRKSLNDLAGTLTSGRERVEREIERAKDLGFYIVFVVEDLYSNTLNYSSLNPFTKKLTGAHILHEVREIMDAHENVQFVFAGNRTRAVSVIENIFRLKDQAKRLDLEYLKDKGII